MTDIHVQVGGDFMTVLKTSTGMDDIGVIREALTLLMWAVKESEEGRYILTSNQDGSDVAKLSIGFLNELRRRSGS